MISATVRLVRTSLPTVIVLALALVILVRLVSGEPADTSPDGAGMASLAPLPSQQRPPASAIMQTALFDPGRRPETISGSIDDLRSGTGSVASPVTIAGVLLSGGSRKAMLSLSGAAPAWNGIGSELGGWRVAAIDREGAVLERDGQSITLKIADRFTQRGKPQADHEGGKPPAETGEPAPPPAPPTSDAPPPPNP